MENKMKKILLLSPNKGKRMKTTQNIIKLLLATTLVFALSACGSKSKTEDTNITVEENTTTIPTVTLKSLMLTVDKISLNKEENTTVKVEATYTDNTTKDVTQEVEWISDKQDAVSVQNHTLTAKKDGNVTVQAKVGATLSNKINLNITWIVDGHVLPPEPDPTVNNATLLGIDVNDNGVRDDVERWIYEEYKDKHPIYIDIAMQASRGYKLILETPERAKEIHNEVRKARHCKYYYMYSAKYFNEPILIKRDFSTKYLRKKLYYNTQERKDAYTQYDTLLSGGSYTLPSHNERKSACDFNTSKY